MKTEEKIKIFNVAIERNYSYDKNTGLVTSPHGRTHKKNKQGYIQFSIWFNNKSYHIYAHQYIWYIIYGEIPNVIDHINGDKSDNRLENIRNVDRQINSFNRKKIKGYYQGKDRSNYRSVIGINNKQIHIGCFNTKEEAHQAYLDAKKIYHKHANSTINQ